MGASTHMDRIQILVQELIKDHPKLERFVNHVVLHGKWTEETSRFVKRFLWPTPYLNSKDLEVLKNYGYHSGGATYLDNFLNRFWWTPLSTIVPKNVHPNILTVAGLFSSIVLGYLPLMFYVPHADSAGPQWIYVVSAIAWILYQTLDAIDGKQARRTGLSSPVGQLLDHGCDALTTFYGVFIIQVASQTGMGAFGTLACTTMIAELYYYSWYEYTFGVFRSCTGKYTGVTEGQLFIVSIVLSNVWVPWLWRSSVDQIIPGPIGYLLGKLTIGLPINELIFVPCAAVIFAVNLYDFHRLFTVEKPKNTSKALHEWSLMGLHLYCNAALAISGAMNRHPYSTTTMIAFYGALLAWKLILSAVAKADLKLIQSPSLPFYFVALITSCGTLIRVQRLESFLLTATALWGIYALLSFVCVNLMSIQGYLGIPLFTVPAANVAAVEAAEKAAAEKAAAEKAGGVGKGSAEAGKPTSPQAAVTPISETTAVARD